MTAPRQPSEWARDLAARMADGLNGHGGQWRVTAIILDGVEVLRAETRQMEDAQIVRRPGLRAGPVSGADGWLWAGDIRCPTEPKEPPNQGRNYLP